VFTPKNHEKTLTDANLERLYQYIWGVLQHKKCHLYRIGGTDDHIHIVTHLHPVISLASLVKDIKLSSDSFIKQNRLFSHFNGWQEGYGGFTYSSDAKNHLIEYVKNQKEHHRKKTFREEFIELLNDIILHLMKGICYNSGE
jgi:REP element-mobilizing transposase RayT